MKKSLKAALLSALVFPGSGHVYLKRYVAAFVLICASLSSMYYLVSRATEKALQVVESVQRTGVPLDVNAVAEMVSQQSTGGESPFLNAATLTLGICWMFGIVDSFRIGAAEDKSRPEDLDSAVEK